MAGMAYINSSITNTNKGIDIFVGGFNSSLSEYMKKVF